MTDIVNYNNYKKPDCHPDKKHAGRGLCYECYTAQYPKVKRATCHTERVAHAKTLCRSCYDRELKIKNPEYAKKQRDNHNKWVQNNIDKYKSSRAKYVRMPDNKLKKLIWERERTLLSFGITIDEEQKILKQQNNNCAICNLPPNRMYLDIDHDHNTGKFRGFLCGKCNKGLGMLGDNIQGLEKALQYLKKHYKETQ